MFTNPPTYNLGSNIPLAAVNRCMSHLVMCESQPAAHICPHLWWIMSGTGWGQSSSFSLSCPLLVSLPRLHFPCLPHLCLLRDLRDEGAEHAAVRVSDLQSNAWQWTWLRLVPKIFLHSLNFSALTSHQWSGFSIHYSFKCCMFQISSFGNFLSALEAQLHIFLDLSLLLTLDLTLSTSCFHLFCPPHLHQHFCLLMNKWMRLKHWNLHTHTHALLLQHVAHITGGFKDFMSSISRECLLAPLNSLLFLLWGLNSVTEFSQDYSYFFKKKLHMWADVVWALNLPITISIATKEVFLFPCLQVCRTWAMYRKHACIYATVVHHRTGHQFRHPQW